jgi:hypothetical protein
MLVNKDETRAEQLIKEADQDAKLRWARLQRLVNLEGELHKDQ